MAKVREEIFAWRNHGYTGASATSSALLRHWFESEHFLPWLNHLLSILRRAYGEFERRAGEVKSPRGAKAGFWISIRRAAAKGWTNKLIWGDDKLILSSLKSGALRRQIEEAGGLKLIYIYIDPPFDVGADFSMDIEIGGETFHKEPNLLEQIAD